MFLKITTALMLLLIPFYGEGALITTDRYGYKDAETDIAVLKSIIARKPDDLVNLKRIINLTFTIENFEQTEKYCEQYLSFEKNSEVAYLKILAAASSGKFKSAAYQTDAFIKEYKNEISPQDITLLKYKQDLYKKSSITRGYPSGAKKTLWGEDSLIKSYIPAKNLFALYNTANYSHSLFNINNNSVEPAVDYPEFMTGIPAGSINFISLSGDGREALISTGSDDSSKIYIRQYIPEKKKWSSWFDPKELNPGKFNHYPNFIDGNTVLFSSSDGTDYDLYISHRDNKGDWVRAYKLPGINTPLDEISAWVHPDGTTMYFSSNGREGMGGFDIYGARLKKNGDSFEASDIKNIVSANTFRNEKYPMFVSPSGKEAYLNFREGKKQSVFTNSEISYKPLPVFFYTAEIADDSDGTPVEGASAEYKASGSADLISSPVYSDGFTGTVLQIATKYTLIISAPQYEQFQKTIVYAEDNADKIRLKKKKEKPAASGYKTLITALKLTDCEESKSSPVHDTLEQRIGVQTDGINYGKNIKSFTECGDIKCALPDGKTINADFVVFGTLTKSKQTEMKTLGDTGEDQYLAKRVTGTVYIIELKLLDTASGNVILSFKRTTANPDSLKNIAGEFVKRTEKFYNP